MEKRINVHAHLSKGSKMSVDERVAHYIDGTADRVCLCGDNDLVEQAFTKHPKQVIGMGVIRLGESKPELIRECRDKGFTGLKMIGPPKAYDDPEYYAYYEIAEELGMPILFHTGHLAIRPSQRRGTISMLTMRPGTLDTIARAFPDLTMIAAHMGAPWYDECASVCFKHKNVYADLSGGTFRCLAWPEMQRIFTTSKEEFLQSKELVLREGLMKKILFGSDNLPSKDFTALYENLFEALAVPEAARREVNFDSAARIFGVS